MKIGKAIRRFIYLTMTLCICAGFYVMGKGYEVYCTAISEVSLSDKVASVQNDPDYSYIGDLPETYKNAIISVEDHRFYSHPGFDVIAIARAVVNDVKAGRFKEGGSTITQQLAKNMYFSQEKELTRKAAEIFMAMDLERNYSKQEILELYVNSIYFGDGYYGIQDASEGYFDKEPEDMTDYESTLLAGVPNAPSAYAPTNHPELAGQRQKQVLGRMIACGYFSQEEAETVASHVEFY